MAIVARGLGQPEDGAIVAAGLGTAEPAAPGGMSALLTGTGSLTATLDFTTGETSTPTGTAWSDGGFVIPLPRRPDPIVVPIRATLTGGSTVTATAIATERPITGLDDLALLLTLELV